MNSIYKVTAASIEKTKKGYKIFKLQLDKSFLATKLVPFSKVDQIFCKLYNLYAKNNESLAPLVGKFISVSLNKTKFGMEIYSIESVDVLQDFRIKLDYSKGEAFSTTLPIYDFLSNMQRVIEPDDSIKLATDFGDMRISKIDGVNVCYQYNTSNEYLNLKNINQIFDRFYKDVILPPYDNETDRNSYYKISLNEVGIVRMENHVKVSYKMTTSGDYDKWLSTVVQKIGKKLPEEHVHFLKSNAAL
jgi:hypothetical protein